MQYPTSYSSDILHFLFHTFSTCLTTFKYNHMCWYIRPARRSLTSKLHIYYGTMHPSNFSGWRRFLLTLANFLLSCGPSMKLCTRLFYVELYKASIEMTLLWKVRRILSVKLQLFTQHWSASILIVVLVFDSFVKYAYFTSLQCHLSVFVTNA